MERIRLLEHDLRDKLFVNREMTEQNQRLERERDGLRIKYETVLSERDVWYTNGTTIDGSTLQPMNKQNIFRSKHDDILPSTSSIPGEAPRTPRLQPEVFDILQMTQLRNDKLQEQIMDLKRELKDFKRKNEELDTQLRYRQQQLDRLANETGLRTGDVIAAKEIDEQFKRKLQEKNETIQFLEQTLKIMQHTAKDTKNMVTQDEHEKVLGRVKELEKSRDDATLNLGVVQRESIAAKSENASLKSKIIHLEKDLKDIQVQNQEFKKVNENLKAILTEMEKTQQQLRQSVEQAEKRVGDFKRESEQYTQLSEESSKKLSAQMLEVDRLKRNVRDLIGEKDELMEQLDHRDTKLQQLETTLQSLREENVRLESGFSETQQRFQNQIIQNERKDNEIKRLKREIEAITTEVARHQEEIHFKKEEVQHAREDLSSMTQENQFLNNKLVKVCEERDQSKRRLEESIARCAEFEQIIRGKEIEYDDLLQNYRIVANENSRAGVTIESYEHDIKELQQKLRIRAEEAERLDERIRAVDDERQRFIMELQAFQFHNEKQASRIVELQEVINETRQEKEKLLEESSNTNHQVHELKRENSEAQKELLLLMKQVDTLTQDNESIQQRYDKERSRTKSLRDELVRSELAEQRVRELESKMERQYRTISEQSDEISKQKDILFKYESQLNKLSGELALSRERESSLHQELSSARRDMDNVRSSLTRRDAALSHESQLQLQLREREAQLTAQVRSLREDLHKLQSKYVALRQDNTRLQDLVTKMDADRDALQREYSVLSDNERRLQSMVRDMERSQRL